MGFQDFIGLEHLLDHGMIDRVVHRAKLREELGSILRLLTKAPPMVRMPLPSRSATVSLASSTAKATTVRGSASAWRSPARPRRAAA